MSKRIWNHPEVPTGETTTAWRSVGQLEDTPEFRGWLEREFPRGAAEMDDEGLGRRAFMKLMGASTALAGFGLASCRRPEQYIMPYGQGPEWVIPGKATYYASAMPRAHGATPLVVTTFEGRPTHLAPNRKHPDAGGADAFANGEASSREDFEKALVELAKAGRKPAFVFGADHSPTRTRLQAELAKKNPQAKFFSYEPLAGEGRKAALDAAAGEGATAVADFTKADRILSLDCDFAALDPQGPVTDFFQRRKPEGGDYDQKADPKSMNRLYAVEGSYSLTGGMADHRLRIAPSQVLVVAAMIARKVAELTGKALDSMVAGIKADEKFQKWVDACAADLVDNKGRSLVLAGSRQSEGLQRIALALNAALGSIGDDKPLRLLKTGTAATGDLAALKKSVEAGETDTIFLLTPANPVHDAPADLGFADLLARDGLVSVHWGMRADATAHAATWHVPATHYLESWADTNSATGVHSIVQPMILPLYDVCVSEIELLLALLDEAGALSTGEGEEGKPPAALAAVRATFDKLDGASDAAWSAALRDGFHAGSRFADTGPPQVDIEGSKPLIKAAAKPAPTAQSLELVFAADASVWDGRWIDNGWLQEAPDPITKLTWDNAAQISPNTAKELGIYDEIIALEPINKILGKFDVKNAARPVDGEGEHRTAPMVKLTVNGVELELPVMIAFGHADNVLTIPLGYGQGFNDEDELDRGPKNADHVGLVGVNRGFDVYPLRTAATSYIATGAKVDKTGKRYSMALTQEHNSMFGRALAREISTAESEKDHRGDFAEQYAGVKTQGMDSHAPPNVSLYKPEDTDGKPLLSDKLHQWGMSIDLSSCMGCNSCLVACQSENNIPIVGKTQVAMGREMHWIRMDRYFASEEGSDPDNPALVPQPVACVQCESAPCETVCPVNATIHSEDGLNTMAYNRCIGTRYCANNCPYKVRRFNYFDYNKRNPLLEGNLYKGPAGETKRGEAPHLQRNPNVTVRMRGVMEKCTYCVQRLKDSKIRQKRRQKEENEVADTRSQDNKVSTDTLRVPVDSVRTACQESCPADAIRFGNLLSDKTKGGSANSSVVRVKRLERNYDLLNYVGTIPRTSYLARVKNPNPAMPDAEFVGKATIHMV